MTRRPDWPEALAACLLRWQKRSFAWGQADCAHFALDVLASVTTANWLALEVPHYHSALSALRALHSLGAQSLSELGSHLIGKPRPASLAQRGDLVLVPAAPKSRVPAFGVCLGSECAALGPCGLVRVPLHDALMSWRV